VWVATARQRGSAAPTTTTAVCLDDHRLGFEPHAETLFDGCDDTLSEREQLGAGRISVVDEDERVLTRNAGMTIA